MQNTCTWSGPNNLTDFSNYINSGPGFFIYLNYSERAAVFKFYFPSIVFILFKGNRHLKNIYFKIYVLVIKQGSRYVGQLLINLWNFSILMLFLTNPTEAGFRKGLGKSSPGAVPNGSRQGPRWEDYNIF